MAGVGLWQERLEDYTRKWWFLWFLLERGCRHLGGTRSRAAGTHARWKTDAQARTMDLNPPALGMMEPIRQERLPRPGQRPSNAGPLTPSCSCPVPQAPSCSCPRPSVAAHQAAFTPSPLQGLHLSAPPRMNVQEEPPVELSLDGDGTLLADFPAARVPARPSGLNWLLENGREMVSRSVGSAYSAVQAADDAEPAKSSRFSAGPAASAFDWPEPDEDAESTVIGAASHRRPLPAEVSTDWPEERIAPRWMRGAQLALVLLGLVMFVATIWQPGTVAPIDEPVDDVASPAVVDASSSSRSPTHARSPPPPPLVSGPTLHYIAYKVRASVPPASSAASH